MKVQRYIDLATKIAEKSTSKFRLGCVIVKKNRVVSVGYNYMGKTHPKSPAFGNYLHCEIRALLSLPKKDSQNATAYVVRIKKNGSLGSSKPCPVCHEALKVSNIRTVYYIDGNSVARQDIS